MTEWFDQGAQVEVESYTEFNTTDYEEGAKRRKIPLFIIQDKGSLKVLRRSNANT